jgi:predicted 3-demethylubiquinone-9 3-methyltransferase (glyoxalase superfamily)
VQKITPFLWFDDRAEEAVNFYVSLFENSKVVSITRYPDNVEDEHMKGMEGKVLTAVFELNGQQFMALDGGPDFKFTEAISMYVNCETQEEVDRLWDAFTSDGGEESQCGWCKDKYGMFWQIIPKQLGELMSDPDHEKAGRVMQAMMQMKKIVVADLQKAYDQVG